MDTCFCPEISRDAKGSAGIADLKALSNVAGQSN